MKLPTPGLLLMGVAGLTATAWAGFALGLAAARDPEGARRIVQRAVREASRGLEHATRLAAEAREQFGDLVAEARQEARDEARDEGRARTRARPKQAGNGRRRSSDNGRGRHGPRKAAHDETNLAKPAGAAGAESVD